MISEVWIDWADDCWDEDAWGIQIIVYVRRPGRSRGGIRPLMTSRGGIRPTSSSRGGIR